MLLFLYYPCLYRAWYRIFLSPLEMQIYLFPWSFLENLFSRKYQISIILYDKLNSIHQYSFLHNAECTQYVSKFRKLKFRRLEKVNFHSNPKKGNAKECLNYHTIALISHACKVMLKILHDRLQQYVNHELPDVQFGFRKGRGTRDQTANICWIIKKQESSRKTPISALLTIPKPLTVWITINCGKFWKRWENQAIWPAFWETCMQIGNSS